MAPGMRWSAASAPFRFCHVRMWHAANRLEQAFLKPENQGAAWLRLDVRLAAILAASCRSLAAASRSFAGFGVKNTFPREVGIGNSQASRAQ